MKITAFNGTHRAGISNTQVLVDNFLSGAREAGAETESISLRQVNLSQCLACKACWSRQRVECVIDDDMRRLFALFVSSDVVVFASPVYVDNVSGLMKTFFDRLIQFADTHWEMDENGECRHCRKYEKPVRMVAISNCGYPEQSNFDPLRVLYRRMARNMQLLLCGEIYRGAGALLTVPVPGFQNTVAEYLQLVRQAGVEVATNLQISPLLSAQLERPWLEEPGFNQAFLAKVNAIADRSASVPE